MAALAAAAPDDLRHIALLIDQLKHDDLSLRVNSTRALVAIATALGPDRTRNELIPFLCESTDDEDEVLVVMAEQLGALQQCVGGVEQLHCLLEPLEALATVEESTVRDKAVASIRSLAGAMPATELAQHYLPLCRRLAGKDWFTARISACGLLAVAHARVPSPQQEELRQLFAQLCRDDTPMVRRVAAANLGLLAEAVADAAVVERELLPLLTMLAEDDQDSVRLQTVDNCATFAGVLREGVESRLMPVVLDVVQDRSWRVRWSAASKFERLCAALGAAITNGKLCPAYVALLQDVEAEVRAAAGFNIVAVAGLMDLGTVLSQLLPCVQQLTSDASEHVRTALASGINDLAPILGREHTIEQLIPLLLNLLRDSSSEVRLNIIAKLDAIHRVIGVERLSQSLLPAIIDLAEDHKWRVRMAIIEHIPLLAQQLGAQFFNEKLCKLCLTWLGDDVHSIRVAATNNLRRLTELFGLDWAQAFIIPRVAAMYGDANYLQRMTALYAVQVLADALHSELVQAEVLPALLTMASDPVPNIRFNVAKTLEKLAPRVEPEVVSTEIAPCLSHLVETDTDRDVKYFARCALRTIAA